MSCKPFSAIDIQGHRGCRGLMPENTIPAFKKAIELGVHTLELDLAITKDKKVVISHEPYMNTLICLDPKGNEIEKVQELNYNIYNMNYVDIKKFDCGSKFHPKFPNQKKINTAKPLLNDLFEFAGSKEIKIKYNIELKSHPDYDDIYTPKPKEFVRLVIEVIKNNNVQDQVNLQSFDIRVLEEIKIQKPEIPVALLIDENEDIFKKLETLSFLPEIISPFYKLLDRKIVRELQSKSFQVIPWTVNTKKDMINLIRLNVNGIITDYPNVLIDILNKRFTTHN